MKLTEEQIARLKTLESERGELVPSRVVEDAKDKASPLHDLFEWNVKKAAHSHWIQRAREVIGAVTVLVTSTSTVIKAPMYVRDTEANGEGYRSVQALRQDPVSARQSLIYTLEVAAGHIRRARDLSHSLGLEREIDELLDRIVGVQQRAVKETVAA
jgi:hypothetical protein